MLFSHGRSISVAELAFFQETAYFPEARSSPEDGRSAHFLFTVRIGLRSITVEYSGNLKFETPFLLLANEVLVNTPSP